ncbi:PucR family transcriptional regulator [Herbiconiux solani]|uniref:PucR family transcriptional regulator n=1 Tax=Herbiconiux solani TaxID=661329 RepID=UPI000825568E|nr:PucR family transcriptional regulator ligand-binding domain-containing protein [Herbiconiux solani]
MPATLDALLERREFALRLLTPEAGDRSLLWAHASDLEDPTPFVVPGQMLLTTGRQFGEAPGDGPDGAAHTADASDSPNAADAPNSADTKDPAAFALAYVDRLVTAGVAALGFGTEVVRHGVPAELVDACTRLGLPLVEVPYPTPFIAIARWIAEVQAAEERSRVDWALGTQRAVSLAALAGGGLAAAVRAAASGLGCDIALFDPDGEQSAAESVVGARARAALAGAEDDVRELLHKQRRARLDREAGDLHLSIQTLGGSGRLLGVLALARAEPFDPADLSVVTTLVALAEVSLERSRELRLSLRALMVQLFDMLRDGRVDAVRRALKDIPTGLPGTRFVVAALPAGELSSALLDTLERRAADRRHRLFLVQHEETVVLLADAAKWPELRRLLEQRRARAGVSDVVGWDGLDSGLVQAARSLERAEAGRIADFSALVSSSFFGLLSTASVAEVARTRLDPLLLREDGRERLREAGVWLRHNGQWDPAARELGIHRHSLRTRMQSVESVLGLELDRFQDRAELWALLAAADLGPTT